MNAVIGRILNYIPASYGTEPQDTPSLKLTGTGTLVLDDLTLFVTGTAATTIDLHGLLVSQVAAQMPSGVTASVLQDGPAELLLWSDGYGIPQTGSLPVTLTLATNPLWQVLAAISREITTTERNNQQTIAQINLRAAVGAFLDWWAASFDITRYSGEPDSLFTIRLIGMTLAPDVNNVAIEQLFESLGFKCSAIDTGPGTLQVQLSNQSQNQYGFYYTSAQIIDIVNQMKAWGVVATVAGTPWSSSTWGNAIYG